MDSKLWEDINEGDRLPGLTFGPLTIKRFLMMIAGTRDFNPQHHNREWNHRAGSKDNYVTHPWHEAMFGRFVTDWSGPESDFRATGLAMAIQVFEGDTIQVEGQVVKKYQQDGDYLAHIEMTTSTVNGTAARATATIAMPSREGGAVKPRAAFTKPTIAPHPDMPDFAKPFIGKVSPLSAPSPYPISEPQIMYWCDMVEDANPLYADTDYARSSRHGGMIAPPMSVMTWTFQRPGQSSDVDNLEHAPFPPLEADPTAGFERMSIPNVQFGIATNSVQEHVRPMRIGDRLRSTSELVNVTPLKRTHLGLGYFTTNLTTYYNMKDEIVGTKFTTGYSYNTVKD